MGRDLYIFKLKCPFYAGFKGYPNLWPMTWGQLRFLIEGGNTDELVLPILGGIKAYCTAWTETANPQKNRNGVDVDLTFREDQSDLFLVDSLVTQSVANYRGAVSSYDQILADQMSRAADAAAALDRPDSLMLAEIPGDEVVLFEQVSSIGSDLLSTIETAVGFGAAVVELALGLVSLCEQIDATSATLQDPTRFAMLYALQDVWRAAQQVANQAATTNVRRIDYVVPVTMGIAAVSTAIYGDASNAMTLLQSNAVENPFAIPAGTVIKAYIFDDASTVASAT